MHPSGPAEGMNTRGIFGEYSREHSGDTPAIDASSTGPSEVSFLMYQFAGLVLLGIAVLDWALLGQFSILYYRRFKGVIFYSREI